MKDGLVFKRDGVMTQEKFLHGGAGEGLANPLRATAGPCSERTGPFTPPLAKR